MCVCVCVCTREDEITVGERETDVVTKRDGEREAEGGRTTDGVILVVVLALVFVLVVVRIVKLLARG